MSNLFRFYFLGFAPNMQRNAPGPQFGGQQAGPSMSPHSCPTGPMQHNVGSYQLGPSYGPQSAQYGPSGNTLTFPVLLLANI